MLGKCCLILGAYLHPAGNNIATKLYNIWSKIGLKAIFFVRKTIFLAKSSVICQKFTIFVPYINNVRNMETKDLNRIKVVLADKKRTNKWLAETLGKDPATVSKWCTNSAQPTLENLIEIARCLEVNVNELLRV